MSTCLPSKELYELWAASYDTGANPLIQAEEKVLAGMLGDVAGQKVLDLGCGTGRLANALARAGAFVTGVDFSEAMLAMARTKAGGDNIRFILGEIHSVPLAEEFDLLLCNLVLNHVEHLLPCFQEMSRLTRTGGRIIVTDLRTSHWLRKTRVIPKFDGFATNGFRHTLKDYQKATLASGLRIQQRRGIRFDNEIVARFPWLFHLRFIAAGYAFEIRKNNPPP